MKKMWTVAALGLLLGAGVATSQSRADEPSRVIYNSNSGGTVIAAPAGDCGCAQGAAPRKTIFQRLRGSSSPAPAAGAHGCFPNSDISCGTMAQEYKFLFGSCRDFFGCPCFKTPEQLLSISEGEYLGRTNPGINRVNKTYP